MTNYSRTTLRELKKRYLNVLKKCLLANLMMFAFSLTAHSGTATDASSLMTELEKNERTVVSSGTHILTYDQTSSLYDTEKNSIIFPNVNIEAKTTVSGGKLYNAGNITFNSNIKLIFKDNNVDMIGQPNRPIEGNTIHNTIAGILTFNSKVDFLNNSSETTGGGDTRPRGIIFNKGTINFNEHVNFKDNTTIATGAGSYGTSIYNKGGIINFTSADFINNKAGSEDKRSYTGQAPAILNESGGQITFTGISNFKNNEVWMHTGGLAGAIGNNGTMEFKEKAIFEDNKISTGPKLSGQAIGGAISNDGIIKFADVDFVKNHSDGYTDGVGGAIFNQTGGNIVFNGDVLFQGNIAEGKSGYARGGAIYNKATIIFNSVKFVNNSVIAQGRYSIGSAISNAATGDIIFNEKPVFKGNISKGITRATGALDNSGIVTFENGFHFSDNETILVSTDENGNKIETKRHEDIYMADGIINIEGSNADAEEYIGGGIRGSEGKGTINKSSVATLVFGEESDSSGYTGIFNQTAGKTVARSETFLGGTNNILGGELETHGSEILYTAVVGQNKDETTGEVLSSGTLTHLALGSEPVEIKGLSFKEEGTNLSMTFKSCTSERARYQINEDIMNATGNKLAFENSELALADNIKVSGTIEAKNSDIDVGTREISVDEIALKENAVLKMTVNSLAEHGKVNGVITGTDTSKIALQLGMETESGIYQLFDRDNEVKTVGNPLFNIQDLEDGSFEIGKKTSEELSSSLSVGKNEGKALSAMMMRSAPNKEFKIVQDEVLEALQSEDKVTVKNAKKALTALSGRSTSLYQSQATAGFTQLHNVVSQMLMNTAAPVFGNAGGEEPARASVYIKGLYDRVNSLTGDGFRMRSKGAVLGVQSAVTEDLTVGVGYAGIDTTAKEPLRRTEVKTNTGFVSAQYQPNNWWVSGVVSYSRSQYDEEKQVLSSTGKANYDVDSLGAQITTGYNIKKGKVIITPEVGIRYLNAKQEVYQDSLGTTVQGTNSDFVTAMAGFKVGADLGWVRPLAGVMVGYDVITDDISSVNTLANGATYTINGKALDRLSTTVVAGFGMDIGENATLKLEYNGNYRKEYLDHSGMIRLEMKF